VPQRVPQLHRQQQRTLGSPVRIMTFVPRGLRQLGKTMHHSLELCGLGIEPSLYDGSQRNAGCGEKASGECEACENPWAAPPTDTLIPNDVSAIAMRPPDQ
jgi:hypothetical protein